jgi:hypothetical protein
MWSAALIAGARTYCGARMSTEPRGPSGDDGAARVLDGIVECWEHAASTMQRMLGGSYDVADAIGDLVQCSAKTAEIGVAGLLGGLDMIRRPPAQPLATSVSVAVPIDPAIEPRQLYSDGFRGLGWDHRAQIRRADVTIQPAVASATVTVSFAHVTDEERRRTIIYEGEVKALGVPAPITDTIRVAKPADRFA